MGKSHRDGMQRIKITELIPIREYQKRGNAGGASSLLQELDLLKPSEEPHMRYTSVASDKSIYIYKEFIKEKYRATKSKMASWKLNKYTQKERAMLANSRVSSRLRYWARFMLIYREVQV